MKFSPRLLLLLLAALTLPLSQMVFPGCAVSSDTSPQALARWQNMPKVHVFLDGLPIGVTPVFARLSRDDVHRLRIEMAGYEPFEFPLRVPSEETPAESPWGSSGILVNVMVNAMQAMPPGGTLTVRTLSSAPFGGASDAPEGVIVEIDDTGHGIMVENAGKLFEPFFTTKPPGQGTGLGLTIARKIMEIHGGSIQLTNHKQGGARATLQFNIRPKDEQ